MMSYMQRALQLAQKGQYTCAPNPMVGCVIVRDGNIVGAGYHHKAGEAHAEVNALQQAGEQAHGATVYVTLEPCSHFGKTPPCVDALIKAQVAEVVIACEDPNPKVAGQGVQRLRAAGIKVTLGELAQEAKALNKIFFHYMTRRMPFVTAKWAMSLDGKIATHTRDSKWITSETARQHAHELRQARAAIIVGSGTVLADDPQLTVRLPYSVHQPLRVVLDSRGRCPVHAKIFDTAIAKTLLVTSESANPSWCQQLTDKGVEILKLSVTSSSIDLMQLLKILAQREISSVLVEGGTTLLTSFIEQDLVQEIYAYLAPKIIGGTNALSPVMGQGINLLADAKKWQFKPMQTIGDDILILAEHSDV